MHTSIKNKTYPSSKIAVDEQSLRNKADIAERDIILAELKTACASHPSDASINWYAYELEPIEGSSLYQIYNPGSVMFNELLRTSPVVSAISQEGIGDHNDLIRVTESGKLEVRHSSRWIDLIAEGYFESSRSTLSTLDVLIDIARQAKGYIWPDSVVTLDQWLKFHDLELPKNIAEAQNLIDYFEFDPAVDDFGDYWGHLDSADGAAALLLEEQRDAIAQATRKILGSGRQLIDELCRVTGLTFAAQENVAAGLVQLVRHDAAQAYAKKYIEELGWFGAKPGQQVSTEDLGQVLITVMLVQLIKSVGSVHLRKSVGDMHLYAPHNVERSSSIVRQELQDFLHAKGWVTPSCAALASHMLLANIAPEFIVKEVPTSLVLGSIEWVSFCRGVGLVEAVSKGACRVLSYSQIMAYASLEPVSTELAHLRNLAMIDPIVDWALINEVESRQALGQAEKPTTERAILAFQQYTEHYRLLANVYSKPLPSRAGIARAAVERVTPDCDFREDKILYHRPGLYASPTAMSMVDLHMSGDLVTEQWDLRGVFKNHNQYGAPNLHAAITNQKRPDLYDPSVESIYSRFPRLRRLKPNNIEFHRQLNEHLVEFNNALATNVKLALAHMLPFDREAFLRGTITFFTVRDYAWLTTSIRMGGLFSFDTHAETQTTKDAATGRFGIVMCAWHRNTVTCYELFTVRGEIRKNIALGELINNTGKLHGPARMDFNGDPKEHVTPALKESLPIKLECYTLGLEDDLSSLGSSAIIEKLGVLAAPADLGHRPQSVYQSFSHPQCVRIAEFIVTHHPFMTFAELRETATLATELEQERKTGDENGTYIVNLMLPFKSCVEQIATGEKHLVIEGIQSCVLDAMALGGGLAAAGSKAATISAKAISNAAKAARLTKLAFTTAISVINPLDDVPSVLRGTGRLVHRGALQFSRQAQEILVLAKSQLGKLHGSHKSYDLISATSNAHIGQGTWRPRGSVADAMIAAAARSDFQWYALDRRGKPWGKALQGFTFESPVRLPHSGKSLPVSYTRKFVEQSLPRVRMKIENAIKVLSIQQYSVQRGPVLKTLLGSDSAETLDRVLKYMKLVRTDFAGFSIGNIVFDPLKSSHAIATFDRDAYTVWKQDVGKTDTPFIKVYSANLNRHFVGLGFNHDVVADDLIHELFHSTSQSADVVYAVDAGRDGGNGQLLDVRPLLTLASGQHPVSGDSTAYRPGTQTFENADSLAITASLLSQLYTDEATFEVNLSKLRSTIGAKATDEPLLLTLNKF